MSVEGTHHVTVGTVVTTSALDGAQTFTASAARARERLLRLPAVRDARVEITVPDRARVFLTERAALGRWVAAGVEWFVDADGVLFSSIDARAAPELGITDERGARQAGDRLDPALVDAALRLARLGPNDLRADATSPHVVLAAGANGLVLRTAAGWEILFGGAERIDEKIALAKRFLRENPQRKLDYVDVRTPDSIVVSPRL
ncbi:MAG TPA: FtsQ-type POTRA domain-containing protein [Candidatus Limnocylindria bacterium]|nr:FtsQ-type POTRA domain-containing protein [Candidatus Limnocylindria bacterium]